MVDSQIPATNLLMETRFGNASVVRSPRGVPRYYLEAFHDGLHKYALLQAADRNVLANKAQAIALQWNTAGQKQTAAHDRIRRTHDAKESRRLHLENQKELAQERTAEAQQLLDSLRNTLVRGIEIDPSLDWEALKNKAPFPTLAPVRPVPPTPPLYQQFPVQPLPSDYKYHPQLSILDKLLASRKTAKLAELASQLQTDFSVWERACRDVTAHNQATFESYRALCSKQDGQHALELSQWTSDKGRYEEELAQQSREIDQARDRYLAKSPESVIDYCEQVLSRSDYPSCISRKFDFEWNAETGMLLLNCQLPAPEDLPTLSEIKYVQTTDTFKEIILSETQTAKLYDDLVYQIVLRTLHELFESDATRAISAIVLNGIVTSTDKSTGNQATACILSVQASRDPFLTINLAMVDPKACFRQLRGVGSPKLHSVTPVAPIVELSRDDKRFVPSHAVAENLNVGSNLATMDWEEFEHLIREIFAKEFSSRGGEVKVTQASRDGGVDAIAFDPDPITGGKIVIQAKRYAYTVGVSAVRDLYGTLMNEGATKGILVTTSDYGPDAHEFAKGKPISLLNGANLLHLLEKHGTGAHINLSEARKLAHERVAKMGD